MGRSVGNFVKTQTSYFSDLYGTGEILGGEDRLDATIFNKAGDSLIGNFGKEEYREVCLMLHAVSRNEPIDQ